MKEDDVTIVYEVNDEKYGKVKLALNKNLQQICIIDGKIEDDPNLIYEIKLRNHLCRRKEDEKYID